MTNFEELIERLIFGAKLVIKDEEYTVMTKTWYSLEEDESASYIKCELTDDRMLVVIPDDELVYIGKVIDNMRYERIAEDEINYGTVTFNKTGEGHQIITKIEFGDENEVEGKCIFEDYESENNIISLGILPDNGNKRADVYADILSLEDIEIA